MGTSQIFDKDPNATLDFTADWSSWLGTDTISTSAWTVGAGLTKGASTNTNTTATVWLSGGTVGQTYTAVNHITTAGGRQDDRTLIIQVVKL